MKKICEHNCSITALETGLCKCYNNALIEKHQPKEEEKHNCSFCGRSFPKSQLTPYTNAQVYCENCSILLEDE